MEGATSKISFESLENSGLTIYFENFRIHEMAEMSFTDANSVSFVPIDSSVFNYISVGKVSCQGTLSIEANEALILNNNTDGGQIKVFADKVYVGKYVNLQAREIVLFG